MATIHSFLKKSYYEAKKQLENGVIVLENGALFFKDEFSALYQETGQFINRMLLPINNFIKDFVQIETELQKEMSLESSHQYLWMDGELLPVEEVMAKPMEENY